MDSTVGLFGAINMTTTWGVTIRPHDGSGVVSKGSMDIVTLLGLQLHSPPFGRSCVASSVGMTDAPISTATTRVTFTQLERASVYPTWSFATAGAASRPSDVRCSSRLCGASVTVTDCATAMHGATKTDMATRHVAGRHVAKAGVARTTARTEFKDLTGSTLSELR